MDSVKVEREADVSPDKEYGRFYREMAEWWPLLSSPEDHEEEAQIFAHLLGKVAEREVHEILELGCGGGNNARHLKAEFQLCLTDLSPEMLAISAQQNPECEHLQADMRSARLGRLFDAVLLHDAASCLVSSEEVLDTLKTVRAHLRPGGAALLAPDFVVESYRSTTSSGGLDEGDRSLRYLEWIWDPDVNDGTYFADYVFMLREGGEVRVERDRHLCGMLPRERWIELIREAGMSPQVIVFEHSEMEAAGSEVFLAVLDKESAS